MPELLSAFLIHRYESDGIIESEIATIITQVKNIICNGFTFRRINLCIKVLA